MGENGFDFRFGQTGQQVISDAQNRGAEATPITFESDPGIGGHVQRNRLRSNDLKLRGESFHHLEQFRSVGWLQRNSKLRGFADPKTAEKHSDEGEMKIHRPDHYSGQPEPCQSQTDTEFTSNDQHQREDRRDGEEINDQDRYTGAADQRGS
jgi:hypothetical protein